MLHKGDRLRVQGVGTPLPDDTECARLSRSTPSGFPQVEAHSTREHHTSDDSISYLDMLSGSLTNVSKPCYSSHSAALRWCVWTYFAPWIPDLLMEKDFKASVLHVSELSIALPWISKNSP